MATPLRTRKASWFRFIMLGCVIGLFVQHAGAAELAARPATIKPDRVSLSINDRTDAISVKFLDDSEVREKAGALIDRFGGPYLKNGTAFQAADGGRWESPYAAIGDARLEQMRQTAQQNLGRQIADLRTEFVLRLRSGQDAAAAIDAFNGRGDVEIALPLPKPMPAPLPPNFQPNQGYLGSTTGINALGVWGVPFNANGAGVRIADVEYSWNLSHLDLPVVTHLGPAGVDPFNDVNHGTAVLGEMGSLNNGWGTTGIAYGAAFNTVAANTASGYNVGSAIMTAAASLQPGDIILIEQQTAGPNYTGNPPGTQFGLIPVEWNHSSYNAIVTAVGNNITVVEAAGNGSQNLDDPIYSTGNGGHWPFLPANDSGAIIVGAGGGGGGGDRIRLSFSCYGSTVDLQGWGENVFTTGYGNSYSSEGPNLYYTSSFSGTSSASPIVAGACALVQSAFKAANPGQFVTPANLRMHLRNTGAPQLGANPSAQNIGPRPIATDAAVAALNWDTLAPTPNPLTFSIAPQPDASDPEHAIFMEATEAADPSGPVEYFIERTMGGPNSGWQLSRSWLTTGLSPNSPYFFRAKARDNSPLHNETDFPSTTALAYTQIQTPTGVSASNVTGASLDLTALGTFNNISVGLSGLFFEVTDPQSDPAGTGSNVWTAVTTSTQVTVSGLLPLTEYMVRVKARNRAGVETPFTAPILVTTLDVIFTPNAPVLGAQSTTSLQLTIDTNGNVAGAQYAIFCTATAPVDPAWDNQYVNHASGAPNGAAEDWQTAGAPITLTGMEPNIAYTFAVKARSPSGQAVSPLGSEATRVTPALVPGAPILGGFPLYTTTIDVSRDADPSLDNPVDTEIAVRCVSTSPSDSSWTGRYVDAGGSPAATETWQSEGAWDVTTINGLNPGTEYVFAVKARDRAGVETGFGPSSSATTGVDCNQNEISDASELANCAGDPACDDCNGNGTLDGCEIGIEIAQWASSLIDFSSQYDVVDYAALQTLGLPDASGYGDSVLAWAPLGADDGLEYVTVGVDTPVYADGAVVRENLTNGFVVKVEAVKLDDTLVEVWPLATGETDDSPTGILADFTADWPETTYLVKGLRVTIDTSLVPIEYEEIDAIRLLGRAPATTPDVNGNGIPDSCETAATPNAPLLSNPTQTGMDIAIGPDSNPPGTEFAIRCQGTNPSDASWDGQYISAAGTPVATEIWQTAAAWATTTLSGMQPDSEYTFASKARLVAGNESPFGDAAGLSTLPELTGACCYSDGSCLVLTVGDCETSGGVHQGVDEPCLPSPCPPPCALLGDINGDERIDGLDVAGYVRAKLGLPAEPGENQACAEFGNGDLDMETAAFVALLIE